MRDLVNSALFLISSFYLASEFWTKLSPLPTNYWFVIISQCGVSSNPIYIAYKTTMHCVTSGILAVCVTGWISEHQMKKPRLISLEFGFAWLLLCMLSWKWTSSIKRELLSNNFLFASLPLKYLSLQAASHFNLLPTSGDTAGTDVPVQVLSAITDSCSPCWKIRMLQSVAELCPPPELVTENLLIPCVGYRLENLRFLKFGSSCYCVNVRSIPIPCWDTA